ncbi:MAG: polymer-forming cytoskeletal protein [Gammaproteobacteria bacterium]|nr:polymer-forming cytoskeletal protein [Gammaproteobacteria bacterium]MBU1624358.1 polymer-forming cytoskeletal protein [Gammaproteobacteria bacterium]MBU1981086.1 polymer-forming cytoskeletal protein [Gammaproteobacteria bacterium]
MFNKHSKPQNRIDSLIGMGTRVNGDIHFAGGLRVDGEVTGSVIADPAKASTLVLSEQAQVHGEISVTHLVVNGMVTGPIQASEYLELQSKAKVTGDVRYKTLEIQLGAIVEGKLVHINEASEKVVSLKVSGAES